MNPDESGYSSGLANSDLDQFLTATNRELLAYIEAATDPNAALTAIIRRATPAGPAGGSATAASGHDADRTPVVLAIGTRSSIRRLSRAIDRALSRALVLSRDLEPTSPLTRGLSPHIARALASDLAWATAGDLDVAHNLARGLVRVLVNGLTDTLNALDSARASALRLADDLAHNPDLGTDAARARVGSIKNILTIARDRVRDIERALGSQQVDASGADLSEITIDDVNTLDGVIWTGRTTWPPSIADQVRACSQQIRPGVYQVHGGSEHDPADFAAV
jgi:hypothetical protein